MPHCECGVKCIASCLKIYSDRYSADLLRRKLQLQISIRKIIFLEAAKEWRLEDVLLRAEWKCNKCIIASTVEVQQMYYCAHSGSATTWSGSNRTNVLLFQLGLRGWVGNSMQCIKFCVSMSMFNYYDDDDDNDGCEWRRQ